MEVIGVVLFIGVLVLSSKKLMYRLGRGTPRRQVRSQPRSKPRSQPRSKPRSQGKPYKRPRRAPPNVGPNAAWQEPKAPSKIIEGRAFITDGDSLIIKKTEIRLFGVDAPEMSHPYGKRAKWALFEMCKGHAIRAHVQHIDGHGRNVAKCYLPDGRDLSAEMVKQGLALDWPKFSEGVYRKFETPDARRKLWLADARQKGRMHVWRKFEEKQ